MGDPFNVRENRGGDFEPVPCGLQHALASRLYDLGWQPGYQGGKPTHQIVVLFELAKRRVRGTYAGQRFEVTMQYNATLGSSEVPSKLRNHLTAWRGREFTAEEVNGFNLRKILGHCCTLSLVEATKADGKKIAKVAALMPAMPNTEAMVPEVGEDFIPEWVAKRQATQLEPPSGSDAPGTSQPPHGAGVPEGDIPF